MPTPSQKFEPFEPALTFSNADDDAVAANEADKADDHLFDEVHAVRFSEFKRARDAAPKPADETPPADQVAAEFQRNALTGLKDTLKGLKVTTDGSAPREFKPQDKYAVDKEQTPEELSRALLGPKANDAQVKYFAEAILAANFMKPGDKLFAKSEIHVPGQRQDGGLYFHDDSVRWHDGSQHLKEAGKPTTIGYRDKSGAYVQVEINESEPFLSRRTTMKDDQKTVEDTSGKKTVYTRDKEADTKAKDAGLAEAQGLARLDDPYWIKQTVSYTDSKGRAVVETYDSKGRVEASAIKLTLKDGSVIEAKIAADGDYHGQKKDKDGKVLDANAGLTPSLEPFSEKAEKDKASGQNVTVRTTEEGDVFVRREADGLLLRSTATNELGRKIHRTYNDSGDVESMTVERERGGPLKFTDQMGTLKGDWLDDAGKKIGSVEVGPQNELIYRHATKKLARTEYTDGRVETVTATFEGGRQTVREKDGEKITTTSDFSGKKLRETWHYKDGTTFTMTDFKNGRFNSITINDDNKNRTTLQFDAKQGVYKGERKNEKGVTVDDVSYAPSASMLFRNRATGAYQSWSVSKPDDKDFKPPSLTEATYDPQRATTTTDGDKGRVVESIAGGRTDTVDPKTGEITGKTETQIKSKLTKDGEATVEHFDGSGARLSKHGDVITVWTGGLDGKAQTIKLSDTVKEYLRTHKDIDHRDVAELYRLRHDKPGVIDKVFTALASVDSAKNLTAAEKSAIRQNMLHHIALDADIAQSFSPSCAVTTVQRDHVRDHPEEYIKTVVRAISEGKVELPDGKTVTVDPKMMKLIDVSGRDLATRIYQNAALSALHYPRMKYVPTEDGVGRFFKQPQKADTKPMQFGGLSMTEITELHYRMTGDQKGLVIVDRVEDLQAILEKNKSVIAGVNARKPPFEQHDNSDEHGAHVVTLLGIDKSPEPRVRYANQWGLGDDHSEQHRSVSAAVFLANLKSDENVRIDGRMAGLGQVLAAGDRKKVYRVQDGNLVEDTLATEALKKERKRFWDD